jgi:glucosamine kinase
MNAVVGIDSGGTKTLAAVVNASGQVLRLASAPGVDPLEPGDLDSVMRALRDEIEARADVEMVAATLGLPFYGEVATITAMEDGLAARLFGPLARACNDVEVAHIGAFGGEDGLLCLAGTGSMAWARGPRGAARAGGFGDLIGDEGSAFRIGQEALGILSQEADGRRPRSAFGTALANALDIPFTLAGVMEWTYRHDKPRAGIASTARNVSSLAAAGNTEAAAILTRAGAALAAIARAAANAAGLGPSARLACAGSVFTDPIVSAEVCRLLGSTPVASELPPVGGAVLDAARRAGWVVDRTWQSALRSNLNLLGSHETPRKDLKEAT